MPTHGRHFAQVPDPEQAAKLETDRLRKELQLTDKQYKKIYKLNLKEQEERLENFPPMPRGRGNFMPPRDGMQPPMMPEGDFSRPSGQARPPMPAQDAEERAEELKKKQEKREKKMKKILTEEQFAKWKKMQQPPPANGRKKNLLPAKPNERNRSGNTRHFRTDGKPKGLKKVKESRFRTFQDI